MAISLRAGALKSGLLKRTSEWASEWPRAAKLRHAREEAVAQESPVARDMTFTFSVIALSAKLAAALEGETQETFLVFREVFPMPASEHNKIHHLFMMAAQDEADVPHYARHIAELFPRSSLLEDVLQRLVKVAHAGGGPSELQLSLLKQTAKCFGISRFALSRILRSYRVDGGLDPHKVLGVKAQWSDAKIKQRYHALVREHHPDIVRAKGGSDDAVLVAQRQVAALNAAYTALSKGRKAA